MALRESSAPRSFTSRSKKSSVPVARPVRSATFSCRIRVVISLVTSAAMAAVGAMNEALMIVAPSTGRPARVGRSVSKVVRDRMSETTSSADMPSTPA